MISRNRRLQLWLAVMHMHDAITDKRLSRISAPVMACQQLQAACVAP